MPVDAGQVMADALMLAKRIRGEDAREVEERSLSEIADAVTFCSDLDAIAGGTRQLAVIMRPRRKLL